MFRRKMMPVLRFVISEKGMKPYPHKGAAISELKFLTTFKQLRREVGIFAYYRKFMPKFCLLAAPFQELTKIKAQGKSPRGKI